MYGRSVCTKRRGAEGSPGIRQQQLQSIFGIRRNKMSRPDFMLIPECTVHVGEFLKGYA